MMHKCYVVKIGGSKKHQLNENRAKFLTFAEIGRKLIFLGNMGNIQNASLA